MNGHRPFWRFLINLGSIPSQPCRELAEWLKAHAWKACKRGNSFRGFESPTLCHLCQAPETIDLYSSRQFSPRLYLLHFSRKSLNISLGSTVLIKFLAPVTFSVTFFRPIYRLKQAVIGAVSYHLGDELRPLQPKGGFMSNLSLYDITEEKEAITALLEMDQGEVTEDHETLITQVEQMIALKTDRVVGFYNYLTDEIDNAKKRRDEITGFIKVREAAQKRLKDYVANCMAKLKVKSFAGEFYEIKERKPSKVLHINHESLVPVDYTTVETVVKVNKAELKQAIKSGAVTVEGIELVDGDRSIQFKTKSLKSKGKKLLCRKQECGPLG